MNSKSLKDIAKEVRTQLKQEFPQYKFSVTTKYASMCQELYVAVMSGPSPFADGSTDRYEQLNHHYLDNYGDEDKVHSPDMLMTAEGLAMIKRVNEIANKDNWDNSDSMIDYFDVNYYFSLHIGKWDRPFVATGQPEPAIETAVQPEPAPVAIEQPEVVSQEQPEPVQPETAVQDDEPVKIVEIKAHGSELGLVNGMTFTSIEQADTVIMSLIKATGMGFAKTKITITWADGDTVTTDSDYCEGETTRATLNHMHKSLTSPLQEWLKRMGVTEERHQARCEEWAALVATHQMP